MSLPATFSEVLSKQAFALLAGACIALVSCFADRSIEADRGNDIAEHREMLFVAAFRSEAPGTVESARRPDLRWLPIADEKAKPALVSTASFDLAIERPPGPTILDARCGWLPGQGENRGVFRVLLKDGRAITPVWSREITSEEGLVELRLSLPEQTSPRERIALEVRVPAPKQRIAAWVDPVLLRRHIAPKRAPEGAYNLLLISADTTRQDVLGSYGGRAETPALDRLAASGVLFHNMHSVAFGTTPSHASIMTSLPAAIHGVYDNETVLDVSTTTLAEVLHGEGWETAAFVGARPVGRGLGLEQGFDVFDDIFATDEENGLGRFSRHERRAWRTVARFESWLTSRPSESPYFAWLHFYDPHQPYRAQKSTSQSPFDSENGDPVYLELNHDDLLSELAGDPARLQRLEATGRDRYRAEVEEMDEAVGRLLEVLKSRGEMEATLVVFVADHGESFAEHGARLMFDHAALFDEVSRLPLIVKLPGESSAGRSKSLLAGSQDLSPSLLDLLGVAPPDEWLGRSFARLIASDSDDFRSYLILEGAHGHEIAVRTRTFLYREMLEREDLPRRAPSSIGYPPGETSQYLNDEKEAEGRDSAEYAEQNILRSLQWIERFAQLKRKRDNAKLDSEGHREALRSLGYLD